jgi:hypothetical protein
LHAYPAAAAVEHKGSEEFGRASKEAKGGAAALPHLKLPPHAEEPEEADSTRGPGTPSEREAFALGHDSSSTTGSSSFAGSSCTASTSGSDAASVLSDAAVAQGGAGLRRRAPPGPCGEGRAHEVRFACCGFACCDASARCSQQRCMLYATHALLLYRPVVLNH